MNPFVDTSVNLEDLQGTTHIWFQDNWGTPSAKTKRFFGGEIWVYLRIDSERATAPFVNLNLNECQISLYFNKEKKLEDLEYSGC